MRLRAIYLPLLLAAALTACSGDEEPRLSESQMADIMADMALAEGYMQNDPSVCSEPDRERLQKSVLNAHGVTKQEYEATLRWYGFNLDKYDALCMNAEKRLARKQERLSGNAGESGNGSGTSLWPYNPMAMISRLAPSPTLKFSIDRSANPDIAGPGDDMNFLTWSMRLTGNAGVNVTLGVDYTDNSTAYITDRPQPDNHIRSSVRLDKSKTVSRIYGVMTVSGRGSLPLWADSIKLEFTRQPEGQSKQYDYRLPTAEDRKKKLQRAPTIKPIKESNDSPAAR